MDIGSQQRVIIVELEEATAEEPDPQPVMAKSATDESFGEWPLPLDINVEPVG